MQVPSKVCLQLEDARISCATCFLCITCKVKLSLRSVALMLPEKDMKPVAEQNNEVRPHEDNDEQGKEENSKIKSTVSLTKPTLLLTGIEA